MVGLELAPDKHWLLTLNHAATPFTLVASNGEDWSWHIGGSWLWRVAYLAGLCLLAAIGACAHGTEGERAAGGARPIVVAVLTAGCLLLAAFTGTEGYYGWDHR